MTVYRTETGKWRFDFWATGKRWTGGGFATKRDALAAQEDHRRAALSGLSGSICTFGELTDAYLSKNARNVSPDWVYQQMVKINKAAAHLRDAKLSELRPDHFEAILGAIHSAGNGARSVNEYRKIMSSVMQYGVDLEVIHRNPVGKIGRMPEDEVAVEPIETVHLKQLILAADPVLSGVLAFQSQTGARFIECERLPWPEVFRGRPDPFCVLTTKKNRSRSERKRPQPLNAIALQVIERMDAWKGRDPVYVFPARDGGPLDYRATLKRLQELCDRLKIPRTSFHKVRHWTGAKVTKEGRSKKATARYLGHTNTAATERYLHYVDAELWAIARELEAESAEVAEVLAEGIHAQTLPAVIEGGK